MNEAFKIKIHLWINIILSIVGVTYLYKCSTLDWLWVSLFGYLALSVIGNSLCYHRYVCHKSYTTYKPIEWFMMFHGVVMALGPPITFAYVHRLHHKESDTVRDPHSPHQMGILRAATGFGWPEVSFSPRLVKDLFRNKTIMFFQKNYYEINFLWALLLFIIKPELLIVVYCIPAVVTWFIFNISNTICHTIGYRNHDTKDRSVNSSLVSIGLLAEGWHNNHHKYPNEWSNWERWWEFDLPTIIIWLIKK